MVQSLSESAPRVSSEKEHSKDYCWVQPANSSARPEHSRVESPGVGRQTGQCTPQVGAVTIGILNPGKMVSGSLADSLLSQVDWIPADLYHQMLCGLFFLALVLWVGDPNMG